jgi:transposase
MKPHQIKDAEDIILGLQDEIRRTEEARYDHRLHAILLVAQGMSSRKAAELLGDSPRAVQYWVRHFEDQGLGGVVDNERPGRPRKLLKKQYDAISTALRKSPREFGLNVVLWDGKTVSTFIREVYKVKLSVRQCQRMFRQLGFRLRKPRPKLASADIEEQKRYKKN